LLSSAQHADKLLGEVESILSASKSKSAFKKYKSALLPAQGKVVEDYVARIRTQLVRVLEAEGISLPHPPFESVHAMRVTLAFVRIAFQECTPDRMRGYAEIPESEVRTLNGLVDEMVSAVEKLDSYLALGLTEDLEGHLVRLARAGADVSLLQILERIINGQGFVEFRPALSMIIDRLETKSFEIAFFGRVSSGKSSLLNHIVQSEILPVGVNPITAVPTRLSYGATPGLTVSYAGKSSERLDISQLPELVSERHNPANYKHVTRILVELPSPRLRDGVALVDTPGLGSLATSGAAETLAYLPRCDLGVVLIDGGSTLTEDDLATIRTLYEAGIPASVLLSKSDLLAGADQLRSSQYISEQISAQLGLTLPVHAVSIEPTHSSLLDAWLTEVILPLYDQHQQLMQESLFRKIGSLQEAVVTALKLRLNRTGVAVDLDAVDRELRRAGGQIAEARELCFQITHAIRGDCEQALIQTATHLTDNWLAGKTGAVSAVVREALEQVAVERAGELFRALKELAHKLGGTLESTARALRFAESRQEEDIASVINEMPKLDIGPLDITVKPGLLLKVSRNLSIHKVEAELRRQIGQRVSEAFSSFGSMLDAWSRRTLSELQLRFEAQADAYRAHINRLTARGEASTGEQVAIARDLALLTESNSDAQAEMTASESI
jgi:GTP-binding protein EngB required for normal cell division